MDKFFFGAMPYGRWAATCSGVDHPCDSGAVDRPFGLSHVAAAFRGGHFQNPIGTALFFADACNLLLINRANMLEGRTKRKRACPAVDNICVSTPRPIQANTLISSAFGE
jgi:hypothetical protein